MHPNDNSEYMNLGMELSFKNLLFLRLGYPSLLKNESIEGPTFGFGLNYNILRTSNQLKIDYSVADFGHLGNIQRLSLGFNF